MAMGAWFSTQNERSDLNLPFSSATIGRRPVARQDWALKDSQQPLASGRSLHAMAAALQHGPWP